MKPLAALLPADPIRSSAQYGPAPLSGWYRPVSLNRTRAPLCRSRSTTVRPSGSRRSAATLAGASASTGSPGAVLAGHVPRVSRTWLLIPSMAEACRSDTVFPRDGVGKVMGSDHTATSVLNGTDPNACRSAAATRGRSVRACAEAKPP